MIQYSFENIDALEKYNRYKVSPEFCKLLEHYTNLVSSPNYNKTPHFLMKKSIILDNNRNRIVSLQDNVKKILNKITSKNYEKLINSLIQSLTEIDIEINNNYTETSDIIIEETNNIIFKNFFISNINIELNIDIYYRLYENFEYIDRYINNLIKTIKEIYKDIVVCTSISFDELDRVNKINSVIKNKLIFLSRLVKRGKISRDKMNIIIIHYQDILNAKLKEDNNKMYCDELSELVLTFLNEKDNLDIKDTYEKKIIDNIISIINSNIHINKNLTNKIILKHKNIMSKLKLPITDSIDLN